jgi:chromosomal replication initiation ATPase DnaA
MIGPLTCNRAIVEDERLLLIAGIIDQSEGKISPESYIELLEQKLCSVYGIKHSHLTKGGRHREVVDARRILFWSLRQLFGLSLSTIGRRYNKDHATILYGLKTFDNLVNTDISFRLKTETCFKFLHNQGWSEPLQVYSKKYNPEILEQL